MFQCYTPPWSGQVTGNCPQPMFQPVVMEWLVAGGWWLVARCPSVQMLQSKADRLVLVLPPACYSVFHSGKDAPLISPLPGTLQAHPPCICWLVARECDADCIHHYPATADLGGDKSFNEASVGTTFIRNHIKLAKLAKSADLPVATVVQIIRLEKDRDVGSCAD
jgi:hypothetical protein